MLLKLKKLFNVLHVKCKTSTIEIIYSFLNRCIYKR